MTGRDAASQRQVQAADPAASTWLSANAGSGKTRVLIDRVARLLLNGVQPQRILCLTYTKAAASEMQNRLFRRLGGWAMLPDPALRAELAGLGAGGPVDAETLAQARRLFARAIETPGGLKIQTIHSFCAGLLRRFPLEAGVSPQFVEMDDRAGTLLREEIVEEMATGTAVEIVDAVARALTDESFADLTAEIAGHRAALATPLGRDGALALFDLPAGYAEPALMAEVFLGGEAVWFAPLIAALAAGSSTDQSAAAKLRQVDTLSPRLADLAALEDMFLTGAKAKEPFTAKIGSFPTKATRGALGLVLDRLDDLMRRVETARPRRLAMLAAERTLALHRFAGVFLPRFEARKAERGWLDFDDLILRASALLTDPSVAQWVLFRLDGGIDHILVDEAQDTSPAQWRVIALLAQEFTAGRGTRDTARTIFVVGDKKQSIYSFQGADLREFDRMQADFAARLQTSPLPLAQLTLEHSFRSSHAILRLVDLTFDDRAGWGLGGAVKHLAFMPAMPGRVDLWPIVPKVEEPEPENWYDPVDLRSDEHHVAILARRVAAEIRRMIDAGIRIPLPKGGDKRLAEGDVLILVQRRGDLFHEIIRACKVQGLAIAGADRLRLGGEMAARDLTALLSFVALDADDLSLAAALRSPLFGWTEAQLYALAHPREGARLWEALRNRQTEFPDTFAMLSDLRDMSDFLRPYDLIERILTRHDGRRRLLARLGPEAEDGIDALLAQAMAYERMEVPSLTGFLVWLESGEVEVKRRPDGAGNRIRVMTVHGAKGLEAPLVILPDTMDRNPPRDQRLIALGQGVTAWRTPADASPPLMANARADLRQRQEEENLRLLYVATTRAQSWLIVCGAGKAEKDASWYSLIARGMDQAGAEFTVGEVPAGFGPIRRLSHGHWPADTPDEAVTTGAAGAMLPDWAGHPAPAPAEPPAPLSPSALGGAKVLAGEGTGAGEAEAMRHGRWLHLLLEHLPQVPEGDWPGLAAALLSSGEDAAGPEAIAAALQAARRVLRDPALAGLFAEPALAEVEIAADLGGRRMLGTIDRLIVSPDLVRVIDYKSNAAIPDRPEDVPEGLLRQMGAYAAALAQVYPGRKIGTAILWTAAPRLMALPPDIVSAALATTSLP
ncbi:MAG: double-strand break repair helicase AddA [Rhodobacteraceae bacterium]|nr:double-strand break repair helicase AddA [Paracoccaceae bacterium]